MRKFLIVILLPVLGFVNPAQAMIDETMLGSKELVPHIRELVEKALRQAQLNPNDYALIALDESQEEVAHIAGIADSREKKIWLQESLFREPGTAAWNRGIYTIYHEIGHIVDNRQQIVADAEHFSVRYVMGFLAHALNPNHWWNFLRGKTVYSYATQLVLDGELVADAYACTALIRLKQFDAIAAYAGFLKSNIINKKNGADCVHDFIREYQNIAAVLKSYGYRLYDTVAQQSYAPWAEYAIYINDELMVWTYAENNPENPEYSMNRGNLSL